MNDIHVEGLPFLCGRYFLHPLAVMQKSGRNSLSGAAGVEKWLASRVLAVTSRWVCRGHDRPVPQDSDRR